ncbi:MAG TPA: AbiH family protein [Flavobacterium sp.]|uniref:AbiH family protein n=2 Tax=Flavobacterium TaxID=237 RepID=UPI0025BAC742|nr:MULTISPECIES: AbiH family protein [unclassified Flavobacterium]HRE76496.1 AbiH family protein [Flavobacterium sp.]
MSKILITGNGFDLFHGLPTKYGHFMAIMETIEQYGFKEKISFEDLFERHFKEKFPNDYESIKEKYKTENIHFEKEKINELAKILSSNSWYKHFKNVNDIETWIDFEIEIENVLKQLNLLFDLYKNNDKRLSNYNIYNPIKTGIYLDIKILGISKKNSDTNYISLDEKFLNKRTDKIDQSKLIKDLLLSFNEFKFLFNKYILSIVDVFMNNFKNKFGLQMNSIDEFYSFNYTSTLENEYKVENSKVIYLHGKSEDSNDLQNIVLGISEVPAGIVNSEVFGFTKYYQKFRKNNNKKFIKIPEENNNFEETIFYVIGHSLDESDKEYIYKLFEYLKTDSNKHSKICVFYFNDDDYDKKLNNLFKIIEKEIIMEMNANSRLYFVKLNQENINLEFNRKLKRMRKIIDTR